jgi:anti-anti-sigma regulatory factor
MLRITINSQSEIPTLRLEGKLNGPWVSELKRSWDELRCETPQRPVAVDLSEVTYVSPEGRTLLESIWRQGAKLESCSLLTRFILNQIRNEANETV